jgi:hypothetical protein
LTGNSQGLEALMKSSPLFEAADVEFERDTSPNRDVIL